MKDTPPPKNYRRPCPKCVHSLDHGSLPERKDVQFLYCESAHNKVSRRGGGQYICDVCARAELITDQQITKSRRGLTGSTELHFGEETWMEWSSDLSNRMILAREGSELERDTAPERARLWRLHLKERNRINDEIASLTS